jgi:hypothetical protein
MRFQILFLSPFRVATGSAADGLDAVHDPDNPLPASSLKGLMKAYARQPLRIDAPLVARVYGDQRKRSPWSWGDAEVIGGHDRIRTQARIDPNTSTVVDTAMFTAGELWPAEATFEIIQRDAIEPDQVELHEMVLAASARAITALGSDRRRGLGWVSIIPERGWDDHHHELLISNREP